LSLLSCSPPLTSSLFSRSPPLLSPLSSPAHLLFPLSSPSASVRDTHFPSPFFFGLPPSPLALSYSFLLVSEPLTSSTPSTPPLPPSPTKPTYTSSICRI